MKSLYHIEAKYIALMEAIEDNDGEIDKNLEEELNNVLIDREGLINAICSEIGNSKSDTVIVKDEIERLGERIATNTNKEERLKIQLIKILKFFEMRSTTKGSKGFAFKTPLYSGFTKETNTVTFDDARLEEFVILTKAARLKLEEDTFSIEDEATVVNKSSKFVTYKLGATLDRELALELVDEKGIDKELLIPVIDKNAAKEYIKNISNLDGVEVDSIVGLAVYNTKESITIT
jgi:hypothetical protein